MATFYAGQTDYIDKLNTLATANDLVGINSAQIATVAGIAPNVTTVAGISANVTTVAGVSTNVTTLAPRAADITTLAPRAANIATLATISANITTVASISSNISTISPITANITTVAGASTSVTTVATNIASVNTVATNIATVNSASANATAAAGSATSAAGSSTLASQWATQLGNPVSGGEYSAKYWAQNAASIVSGSLRYRGTWSAALAYPSVPAPLIGDYWKVSVAGNATGVIYDINDSIIYNGTTWDKIDNTEESVQAVVAITTTTYTIPVTTGNSVILCNTGSNSTTVTLPTAVSNKGTYIIKKISASNTMTIDGNASETIEGETTIAITALGESLTLVSDGANWRII